MSVFTLQRLRLIGKLPLYNLAITRHHPRKPLVFRAQILHVLAQIGDFRALNTPIKLSRTPGGARSEPPRFNQHGREVLLARGFSEAEIATLENDGVIVAARRK